MWFRKCRGSNSGVSSTGPIIPLVVFKVIRGIDVGARYFLAERVVLTEIKALPWRCVEVSGSGCWSLDWFRAWCSRFASASPIVNEEFRL